MSKKTSQKMSKVIPQSPSYQYKAVAVLCSRWHKQPLPLEGTRDDLRKRCQTVLATLLSSEPQRTGSQEGATHTTGEEKRSVFIVFGFKIKLFESQSLCYINTCVNVFYLWGNATGNKMLKQLFIMMGQHILSQAQHIKRRVGKILKPVLAPVHCKRAIQDT